MYNCNTACTEIHSSVVLPCGRGVRRCARMSVRRCVARAARAEACSVPHYPTLPSAATTTFQVGDGGLPDVHLRSGKVRRGRLEKPQPFGADARLRCAPTTNGTTRPAKIDKIRSPRSPGAQPRAESIPASRLLRHGDPEFAGQAKNVELKFRSLISAVRVGGPLLS